MRAFLSAWFANIFAGFGSWCLKYAAPLIPAALIVAGILASIGLVQFIRHWPWGLHP